MPISPDIQKAIDIIDLRIGSLVKIKELLIKEFGADEPGVSSNGDSTEVPKVINQSKQTRKETLILFMKTNGPNLRKDILAKTAFPKGTLAFLLNDKKTFTQHEDGKWDLVK